MDELWQKAAKLRNEAIESGDHHAWLKAWAARSEAERADREKVLQMSPAKTYYPKEIHGEPAAGVLPEERPRRRRIRKEGGTMARPRKNTEGASPAEGTVTKTRAKGIDLCRKRLTVVLGGVKRLATTDMSELTDEQYEAQKKCLNTALADALAAMDAARAPKEEVEEEQLLLPY